MSLRTRLLLAVGAALVAGLLAAAGVTVWQSAALVRAELLAALDAGARGVQAALPDIGSDMAAPDAKILAGLVASFDGNRHVRASLLVPGLPAVTSQPAQAGPVAPAWFAALMAARLPPRDLKLGNATLRLAPLPQAEIGERWLEARALLGVLTMVSALSALLCFIVAVLSLRPLRDLAAGFARLESAGARAPVPETGPPELRQLAAAFNRMQRVLGAQDAENQRLAAQLAQLADEERAELARDLHDEMGPLVFAIAACATAVQLQEEAGQRAAAAASLRTLSDAAAELQAGLRGLLHRLRDGGPEAVDLLPALEDLLAFWRRIRPQTSFHLQASTPPALAEPARAALFRVAQEGVANAVRHGQAHQIVITLAATEGGVTLCVQDDGKAAAQGGGGYGLIGLRERLDVVGGRLTVVQGDGWRLTAWAPAGA